ncbi:diphthine--ammonia ligase [Salegentibacter sp. F188]|uniref:Diphthine--ammonia ligase n=1 Tax=Autumnicola patrickiae TaxID=3075591 RepID=A0ABU3E7Y4_9FLAO|nr:diphthine--ammonia ligase [Salegentibacter sp. F188]MDT0691784.1 diphthine--ammonia ligase [Salegentibacter sp. F188]
MKRAYLNWSSGKDSALALYKLQQQKEYSVEKLVTTINTAVDRVSMHGLRNELLFQQAMSIGLPLQVIALNGAVSMEEYNSKMEKATELLLQEGFNYSIFGDIFLENLRDFREEQLKRAGLKGVYPLWKKDSSELIEKFLSLNFKAIVVCVNAKVLDKSFCGRIIDQAFLDDLPEGVDPCGENGEFHSFVFDGPIFQNPIAFEIGEKVEKSYSPKKNKEDNCFSDEDQTWDSKFWYCDLLPK